MDFNELNHDKTEIKTDLFGLKLRVLSNNLFLNRMEPNFQQKLASPVQQLVEEPQRVGVAAE